MATWRPCGLIRANSLHRQDAKGAKNCTPTATAGVAAPPIGVATPALRPAQLGDPLAAAGERVPRSAGSSRITSGWPRTPGPGVGGARARPPTVGEGAATLGEPAATCGERGATPGEGPATTGSRAATAANGGATAEACPAVMGGRGAAPSDRVARSGRGPGWGGRTADADPDSGATTRERPHKWAREARSLRPVSYAGADTVGLKVSAPAYKPGVVSGGSEAVFEGPRHRPPVRIRVSATQLTNEQIAPCGVSCGRPDTCRGRCRRA